MDKLLHTRGAAFEPQVIRWFVLIGILAVVRPAFATVQVAIVEDHRILFAVDGKALMQKTLHASSLCKIVVLRDCAFATLGVDAGDPPAPSFSLKELARRACGGDGDLHAKADSLLATLWEIAPQIIDFTRWNNPEGLVEFSREPVLTGGLFVGIQGGKPVVLMRGVRLKPDGQLERISEDYNADSKIVTKGIDKQIRSYLDRNPDWWDNDHLDAIRQFVDIAIEHNLGFVGPPVSILEITPIAGKPDQAKFCWIEGGNCQAESSVSSCKRSSTSLIVFMGFAMILGLRVIYFFRKRSTAPVSRAERRRNARSK